MKPILVHVHIYYIYLWEELKHCLDNISIPYDLYVTMVEDNKQLKQGILEYNNQAIIEVVENRGFDIGPFIHVLNKVDLDKYEYVVKLHTKRDYPKSICILNNFDISGDKWRKYLLSFCLTQENWEKTMGLFNQDSNVGMIADAHLIFKLKYDREHSTKKRAYKILEDMCLEIKKETFIMGSMFIIRAKLLKPLQKKFNLSDFTVPDRKNINTLAHDMERVFGLLVSSQGMKIRDYEGKLNHFERTRIFRSLSIALLIIFVLSLLGTAIFVLLSLLYKIIA